MNIAKGSWTCPIEVCGHKNEAQVEQSPIFGWNRKKTVECSKCKLVVLIQPTLYATFQVYVDVDEISKPLTRN